MQYWTILLNDNDDDKILIDYNPQWLVIEKK